MSLIPKTYNFSEPIPEPFVHEIFTTEEYEKDEETSQVVEKEEEDSPAPVEKETTWLIRGELSTVTAVENLIYLRYLCSVVPFYKKNQSFSMPCKFAMLLFKSTRYQQLIYQTAVFYCKVELN